MHQSCPRDKQAMLPIATSDHLENESRALTGCYRQRGLFCLWDSPFMIKYKKYNIYLIHPRKHGVKYMVVIVTNNWCTSYYVNFRHSWVHGIYYYKAGGKMDTGPVFILVWLRYSCRTSMLWQTIKYYFKDYCFRFLFDRHLIDHLQPECIKKKKDDHQCFYFTGNISQDCCAGTLSIGSFCPVWATTKL